MIEAITSAFETGLMDMLIQFSWLSGLQSLLLLFIGLIAKNNGNRRIIKTGNFWVIQFVIFITSAIYIFIIQPLLVGGV